MTKIIAVVNQKGGVGKTTTAINVAAQLAGSRSSVLLVDLDPQGNATSGLAIPKESAQATTYNVLNREVPLASAAQKNQCRTFICAAGQQPFGGRRGGIGPSGAPGICPKAGAGTGVDV